MLFSFSFCTSDSKSFKELNVSINSFGLLRFSLLWSLSMGPLRVSLFSMDAICSGAWESLYSLQDPPGSLSIVYTALKDPLESLKSR